MFGSVSIAKVRGCAAVGIGQKKNLVQPAAGLHFFSVDLSIINAIMILVIRKAGKKLYKGMVITLFA
jgi:hypothetical protein